MNVLMPQLGETVAEGTVAAWHKKVGDAVAKNDILLDVETDKAAVEVPAPIDGVITSILVEEGQTVDVGVVLAVISGAEAREAAAGQASDRDAAAEGAPDAGPGAGAPEISDAAPATADGPAERTTRPAAVPRGSTGDNKRLRLSPVVRRLIAEHGLDPQQIPGSGRDGRITRNDVMAALEGGPVEEPTQIQETPQGLTSTLEASLEPATHPEPESPSERAPMPSAEPASEPELKLELQIPSAADEDTGQPPAEPPLERAPPVPQFADGERLPFDRIRRVTAEHMVRSKATSPHVLQAVEVDFSAVDRVRLRLRESWRRDHGFSLTYLPFIARASCLAIRDFPRINASVDGDGLVLHKRVHLSFAVDLNFEGLVAPVIRDADGLTVSGFAHRIHEIGARARDDALSPDELSGGTYTLSNNGSFGTLMTAAIINQPQVAILSVDAIKKRPVVIEGGEGDSIGIRPMGILSQSFDHRAIDGAYSAAFLHRLRTLLERKDWSAEL